MTDLTKPERGLPMRFQQAQMQDEAGPQADLPEGEACRRKEHFWEG